MLDNEPHSWLKSKGYIHLTPKIDVRKKSGELIGKVTNPEFVRKYAFFPLIHSLINERRFKIDLKTGRRGHKHLDKNNEFKKTVKKRPLHYATHMDALIFGYYSELISVEYEKELIKTPGLSDCVTAYRKIRIPYSTKHKGTIHLAKEVFNEISSRAKEGCVVLKFDIKSYFSEISHAQLKEKWIRLFNENSRLPKDHFNIFKATTEFSYVLKDDFRLKSIHSKNQRRPGFDEKRLAEIRNRSGKHCFFGSTADFRNAVKSGQLKIHKYPFRKNGQIKGIPQGLPISSVLANLYLIDFDKAILNFVTSNKDGFYRRYSDDIIAICKMEEEEDVLKFITNEIQKSEVIMSDDKTERFLFSLKNRDGINLRLESAKFVEGVYKEGLPLTYLGFEFYGHRTAIKSANLAKFYRRMIKTVKRKAKRAVMVARENPGSKPFLFKRQLHRIYTLQSLSSTKFLSRIKSIVNNERGGFKLVSIMKPQYHTSNYLGYVKRAATIMCNPNIEKQVGRHKIILQQAIKKHINKAEEGNI